MIHVDVKTLGRIPDGGGHRRLGRAAVKANSRTRNLAEGARSNRGLLRGYTFIHHGLDDHSRYVYSEILPDETKETAPAFMRNAIAAFAAHGVKIKRVMTDTGSCYRSRLFARTLAEAGISHKRTRPYRPQTKGKVESFNRIIMEEWAYARTYTSAGAERDRSHPGTRTKRLFHQLQRKNHLIPAGVASKYTILDLASPCRRSGQGLCAKYCPDGGTTQMAHTLGSAPAFTASGYTHYLVQQI
jgi:transposase InsO family protein